MKKTFKIGESAIGGIVQIETNDNANVIVTVKEWTTKKVVEKRTFSFVDKHKILIYLESEITTSFYADKIINSIYS